MSKKHSLMKGITLQFQIFLENWRKLNWENITKASIHQASISSIPKQYSIVRFLPKKYSGIFFYRYTKFLGKKTANLLNCSYFTYQLNWKISTEHSAKWVGCCYSGSKSLSLRWLLKTQFEFKKYQYISLHDASVFSGWPWDNMAV